MTNAVLVETPRVGSLHVRVDEVEAVSARPRRGALPCTRQFCRKVTAALLCIAALSAAGDSVFENARMRLVVGDDAIVKRLTLKRTGEEMLVKGRAVPFVSAEMDRPMHNEVKLIHPHKRVVYAAKSLRRTGDLVTVEFEREPFSAELRVRMTDDYLYIEFVRFVFDRRKDYGNLKMDTPPIAKIRPMQLAVAERANFGEWLNVVWDDRAAAAVVGASPWPEVDHDDVDGGRILYADLRKDVKMKGVGAALVVGDGKRNPRGQTPGRTSLLPRFCSDLARYLPRAGRETVRREPRGWVLK